MVQKNLSKNYLISSNIPSIIVYNPNNTYSTITKSGRKLIEKKISKKKENLKKHNKILEKAEKEKMSIKTLKKQFVPLNRPNKFLFSSKRIKKNNSIHSTVLINNIKNNSLKKYLTHKNSFSDTCYNKINYSNNNSTTTSNTHTNSNNKSSSSIGKKKQKFSKKNTLEIIFDLENKKKFELNEKMKKDLEKFNNELPILTIDDIKNSKEYINDILENLLDEEKNSKLIINYDYFSFQNEINNKMRSILIDWLIDVHLKFNYTPETLFTTIYIIDNYLSKKKIERKNFQLLGVASLLIASKQNEILFHRLREYAYITDNAYTENDVLKMENDILKILDFNLLFPSALGFYEILADFQGFRNSKKIFYFGEFLIESFYLDANCLKYNPSTIACAAGYIAMKFFKMKNYKACYDKIKINVKPLKTINEDCKKSNNYPVYVIKECAKDICYCMVEMNKNNLKSTLSKFSSDNYDNVAGLIFGGSFGK